LAAKDDDYGILLAQQMLVNLRIIFFAIMVISGLVIYILIVTPVWGCLRCVRFARVLSQKGGCWRMSERAPDVGNVLYSPLELLSFGAVCCVLPACVVPVFFRGCLLRATCLRGSVVLSLKFIAEFTFFGEPIPESHQIMR